MPLIDDVKAICDRLSPLGWQNLLMKVTDDALNIEQKTAAALQATLTKKIPKIDRTLPGFEDFNPAGTRGIAPGVPSQSLLYHALASPRVIRDGEGALLGGYPTISEIETVENFVFAAQPRTLEAIKRDAGTTKLAPVVFASEYRPAAETIDRTCADIVFSRTGIARIGTARPKYLPDVRGYWPEDENNPHAFRVVPARFSVWLAAPRKGRDVRIMDATRKDDGRTFWTPVHKLFDGPECISGLDLSLGVSARFFNMKLKRVLQSLKQKAPDKFPYVIEEGLAELHENSEFGRIAAVPVVQDALVRKAIVEGKPLTYRVPRQQRKDERGSEGFATYVTPFRMRDNAEIHPFPAYVHARTKVVNGAFVDLNDEDDVNAVVNKGGYDALLYMDMTGEGWVAVDIPQLGRKNGTDRSRPAYVLLSAPDFFPSCGQRELSRWANSAEIPKSFRKDRSGEEQLWGVAPTPLSNTRRPANLQLPNSPFVADDGTMTAIIAMGERQGTPLNLKHREVFRAATMPDDGAGEFAPGWDVAADVDGPVKTGTVHLAAYGLGSPFPEDAKLCAALSTFWPAVAPDVYRTMSMHTGNPDLRGTVAPLTDEEIGQIGTLPWDGVTGPKIIEVDGKRFAELARFLNVDYVTNAVENRFSNRLLARVGLEDYERRVLAAARVHWVLSGGTSVSNARKLWFMLSFKSVSGGDPELQQAQNQAGHVLDGTLYRVEVCFVGEEDPSIASPKGPRFRLLPIVQHTFFFVAPEDPVALMRRETNPQWGRVAAE